MTVQGPRPRLTGIRGQEDDKSKNSGTTTLKENIEYDWVQVQWSLPTDKVISK